MRKRKTPVLMISALALLLLVVAAINSGLAGRLESGHSHEPQPETPKAASDMKDQMKQQLDVSVGTEAAKPVAKVPDQPTVAREKPQQVKQMPHDSMTNSKWFDDDSGARGED